MSAPVQRRATPWVSEAPTSVKRKGRAMYGPSESTGGSAVSSSFQPGTAMCTSVPKRLPGRDEPGDEVLAHGDRPTEEQVGRSDREERQDAGRPVRRGDVADQQADDEAAETDPEPAQAEEGRAEPDEGEADEREREAGVDEVCRGGSQPGQLRPHALPRRWRLEERRRRWGGNRGRDRRRVRAHRATPETRSVRRSSSVLSVRMTRPPPRRMPWSASGSMTTTTRLTSGGN